MNVEAVEWAFTRPIVRAVDKLMLLVLARNADEHDEVGMTIMHLRDETGLDRKSILVSLQRLRAQGWIVDTMFRVGVTGRVTVYRLTRVRRSGMTTERSGGPTDFQSLGIEHGPKYDPRPNRIWDNSRSQVGRIIVDREDDTVPIPTRDSPNSDQKQSQIRSVDGSDLGPFPVQYCTLSSLSTKIIVGSQTAAEVRHAAPEPQTALLPTPPQPPPAKPPRAPRSKPRSAIAADRQPDDIDRAAAAKAGVDIRAEWPRFVDWHLAKGTLNADWRAAWRTWCGNSQRFNGHANGAADHSNHRLRTQL